MSREEPKGFSIIAPLDPNRLEQFTVTKRIYDEMPEVKEFIIPTRRDDEVKDWLQKHDLTYRVRLVPYAVDKGFNVSKALNIGVREARYENIIITSPEVKPTTPVLRQLSEVADQNVICQVFDQDPEGNLKVLVSDGYRSETPAMYFLAMFQKADILKINGWDEEFMKGYAYEDNDFGARWVRAGLPFIVRDDIQAVHQYHPRGETIPGGMAINAQHYHDNTDAGVTWCKNGIIQ